MADIKRQDVESLAGKLKAFSKDLPEQEQNVLDWIMSRAETAPQGVSDEDLDTVAGGGLADAMGFGPGEDSISVTWSKSFQK